MTAMEKEAVEGFKEAGEISKKAKALVRKLVKPGASVLDIVNQVEGLIEKEGAKPGFPLNFSINTVAAHYTPPSGAELEVGEDDIIKIDTGVHVDGYPADTAITISTSESETHLNLIAAAEAALEKAIEIVSPGIRVGEIGAVIQKEIESYVLKPIENLCGHSVERYNLHAGMTIPNVAGKGPELKEGMAIAIEPFSTNGLGRVSDAQDVYIYEYMRDVPTRNRDSRKIHSMARDDFSKLPFATRWLGIPELKSRIALKELVNNKAIYSYPVLKEAGGGLVAQAEHTMIVTSDGAKVTT
jgi:methionyl aminopeptidase